MAGTEEDWEKMRETAPVTAYWMQHYSRNGLCELCGNSGMIDTTGVKTAAGVLVGTINFCICPNGQALRRARAG